MSKRVLFVSCFVLVLGLGGAAWADPIDVNNPSFELTPEGTRVPGHAGFGSVMAWEENADDADGFVGVDVQCPYAGGDDPLHCHRWPGPTETGSGTDVVYCYLQHSGTTTNAYQVLDMNNSDANAVIMAGRRYTLTFDATIGSPEESGNPLRGSLFYPEDVGNPDVNHNELVSKTYPVLWIDRPLEDCEGESNLDPYNQCPDWNYDLTVKYVATAASPGIGKTLGVKLIAEALAQDNWTFIDNIRVEWEWVTQAYDPNPDDKAELVTKNPTLTWKPGTLAYQHEVYFGTDETAVANANSSNTTGILEFDVCDVNNYTPTSNPLVLGQTYYWKITEVNDDYVGPVPPAGPWEGDVWSFRVEGHAHSPSPFDGERDVKFLGLALEWAAGAEATNHVVYLGTDETAVSNATTSSDEYQDTLGVGTESYPIAEQLKVGQKYYWRIDEKSATHPDGLKGDVWNFKVGSFLVVENLESYANNDELAAVWTEYYSAMSLEWDVNIVRSVALNPSALMFSYYPYYDYKTGYYLEAQDMSLLEIGSDWTQGGVKALMLYMRGDPCTVLTTTPQGDPIYNDAWPWVELEDTSSRAAYILYPADSITDILDASWHEWNIDLGYFPDANGVTLSAIKKLTIGCGGPRAGQTKAGAKNTNKMWFDDIRLYPPRCRPEVSQQTGDFTGDCNVMYDDLGIIARDWLFRDGYFATEQQDLVLTEVGGTVAWTTGWDGNAALAFDGNNFHAGITDPGLNGITNMSITAWVRRSGDLEWVGIVSSREDGDATELGIPGAYGGAGGANHLEYCWNEIEATWKHHTNLEIHDANWTFVAFALEPTGCDFYMRDINETLQKGTRHNIVYDPGPLVQFSEVAWVGRGKPTGGYFKGGIDDVRIFDWTLDANEMAWLSSGGASGYDPGCPAYWWKLDEGAGLTSVDDGCGATVYRAVQSPANIIDPEPIGSRFLNFYDYAIMADHWMEQSWWPAW